MIKILTGNYCRGLTEVDYFVVLHNKVHGFHKVDQGLDLAVDPCVYHPAILLNISWGIMF